jgi:DNA polymerase III subunit gamma/tau
LSYVSLYRKYRPQTFTEVVGQEHVTRTLINALEEDRLHHAYLFTGPRGTGKTSTARILAKSINCEHGPTATPCNECRQCTEITNGSSVDVIELDMASHGGVDDARELRDRALFAPASGRKKVYILDEVHMASTAAFNALLKLIEEPPSHVVFAMATTDPQKVLPTIMSRVQRLDLRRVPAAAVAAHVLDLVAREGGSIDDAALDAVVRAGEGSVRDTLSVLEQVLSYSHGQVTGDVVAQVLGHTPFERTAAGVDAAARGDLAACLALVQELLDGGYDLRRFAFDLLQHLRDLIVLQVAPDHPDLVDATEDRRRALIAQAGEVPRDLLVHAVDLLATAITEMRLGPPRLPLELVFAKLTLGSHAPRHHAPPAPVSDPAPPPPVPEPSDTPVPDEPRDEVVPEPSDATVSEEPPTAEVPEPADATGSGEVAAEGAPEPAAEPATEAPAPDLAERARARAEQVAAQGGPPAPPEDRPPGFEVDIAPPAPTHDAADLDRIQANWDGILDLVRGESPRFHAMFEPGRPVKLRNNVLTLSYGERYRSFHAQNARKAEYADALTRAVETSTGLTIKVDTVIDGDAPRPPGPQPVGAGSGSAAPDPAAHHEPPPAPAEIAEELEVREAEGAEEAGETLPPEEAMARAASLIVTRLGARELESDDLEG